MAECSSCGARVWWVRMEPSGKRMPVDAEALTATEKVERGKRTRGLVNVFEREDGLHGIVLHDGVELPEATPIHRSHFASCPSAREHRQQARNDDPQMRLPT